MFYFRHPTRRRLGNLDCRLDPKTTGKWIISGKRSYVSKFYTLTREYVKIGELPEIKFTRIRKGKWALLVYADQTTKQEVRKKLGELDLDFLKFPLWISNDYTRFRRRNKNLLKKIALKVTNN